MNRRLFISTSSLVTLGSLIPFSTTSANIEIPSFSTNDFFHTVNYNDEVCIDFRNIRNAVSTWIPNHGRNIYQVNNRDIENVIMQTFFLGSSIDYLKNMPISYEKIKKDLKYHMETKINNDAINLLYQTGLLNPIIKGKTKSDIEKSMSNKLGNQFKTFIYNKSIVGVSTNKENLIMAIHKPITIRKSNSISDKNREGYQADAYVGFASTNNHQILVGKII